MSNLPDGCTPDDIDRFMEGDLFQCPACLQIWQDANCDVCAECGYELSEDDV